VSARVTSHGFSDVTRGAWFSLGGETTLRDGDRRPEASVGYASRYLADLPSLDRIADDLRERAAERIGSGPIESGVYPAIIENRVASRILGLLLAPIAGSTLHEGRSCLRESLDTRIASERLTIVDDPLIPRGLASHAWDGDGRRPVRRDIVRDGVLKTFYLNTYYARKLGMSATTGGRSNWVVPAGPRPWQEVAAEWPRAVLVTGFLGGNANPTTGDFSFGIRGRLVEHGVPTRALSEMNVAGNLAELLPDLVALGDDPWVYGSTFAPALVFGGVRFSGK
jgi:PmbA protein